MNGRMAIDVCMNMFLNILQIYSNLSLQSVYLSNELLSLSQNNLMTSLSRESQRPPREEGYFSVFLRTLGESMPLGNLE